MDPPSGRIEPKDLHSERKAFCPIRHSDLDDLAQESATNIFAPPARLGDLVTLLARLVTDNRDLLEHLPRQTGLRGKLFLPMKDLRP